MPRIVDLAEFLNPRFPALYTFRAGTSNVSWPRPLHFSCFDLTLEELHWPVNWEIMECLIRL
jgi:hypothetical protein